MITSTVVDAGQLLQVHHASQSNRQVNQSYKVSPCLKKKKTTAHMHIYIHTLIYTHIHVYIHTIHTHTYIYPELYSDVKNSEDLET